MKVHLTNILLFSIILQVLATQGIITFNLFNLLGNWEIKSILHPIGVMFLIVYFILKILTNKKLNANIVDITFFIYLCFSFLYLTLNSQDFSSLYIAFREVILIFLLIYIYNQCAISIVLWRKILKFIYILIILNLLFVALTYLLGAENYMKLITGRFIWPVDPEYKFKISNFFLFWRSPGLVGEAAAVGYFALISYFLFLEDSIFKKKAIFPLLLAIVCFVRSVYLVLIIFWLLKFLLKTNNLKKMEFIAPFVIPAIILISIPLYIFNFLSINSISMRIQHWIYDIDVNFFWLIGGAIGKVGGAVRGEGFVATLDSYWLLMLFSVGIIGILLLILFLSIKAKNDKSLKLILLSLFFTSFFITISQSIPFLVLFPLLFLKKMSIKTSVI